MEFERKRSRHRHIDVAPLVDVVFNLLLFFMITYNVAADPAIRIPASRFHHSGCRIRGTPRDHSDSGRGNLRRP